jgi:hypothetical protein
MESFLAAEHLVLQALSEEEATCLAEELRAYAVAIAKRGSRWEVSVAVENGDAVLEHVIEAAMECFADRRVTGFVLVADGHRYALGID